MDDVNWFFFDYFILGYVDVPENTSADSTSPGCLSQCLVAKMSTSVYIEVSCYIIHACEGCVKTVHLFA